MTLAHELAPKIQAFMDAGHFTVATQDWHPPNHVSFSSRSHPCGSHVLNSSGSDVKVFLPHCIAGLRGSDLAAPLEHFSFSFYIKKGTKASLECLSAFRDNAKTSTGLDEWLKSKKVDTVVIVGVATEHCIYRTALDAIDMGFKTYVVIDCVAGVDEIASLKALNKMKALPGIELCRWDEVEKLFLYTRQFNF